MPRKAKDETKLLEEKVVKGAPKSKKTTVKKETTSTKKTVSKKEIKKIVEKKSPSKKKTDSVKTKKTETITPSKKTETKNTKTKATIPSKNSKTKKSKTETTVSSKETKVKNSKTKDTAPSKNNKTKKSKVESTVSSNKTKVKNSKTKNTAPSKNSKTKKSKTTELNKENITKRRTTRKKKLEILEYYDLPYRYNQTVVKILAQTPNTLFIYWDISDEDRNKYISQYGEYFFNNTKPVLIIHNKTNNYSFEIDINDFANSWYLHTVDCNCDYQIELGRRPINQYIQISNNYMNITTSNNIVSPNDHILFDTLSHFVYFRNIKTNQLTKKNITNLSLLNKIGKFVSIKDFYQKLYKDETIGFDKLDLKNQSSS